MRKKSSVNPSRGVKSKIGDSCEDNQSKRIEDIALKEEGNKAIFKIMSHRRKSNKISDQGSKISQQMLTSQPTEPSRHLVSVRSGFKD